MDEKMNEALKGLYENLTEEQKEKAKACKTVDEILKFVEQENIELPEELMEQVAGGWPDWANPTKWFS